MDSKKVIEILIKVSEKIDKNKEYLTELDAVIGDGDHGLNMSKGFKAVSDKLKAEEDDNIGNILKKTGMTLVSNVGGASGPLYGTAFMKASMALKDKNEIDINDFLSALKLALEGIKSRGKSTEGEKTMIDALSPAIKSMEDSIKNGDSYIEVLEKGKDAALEGVEFTKTIKATKGRASYLGDRSIGHQDPGATSCFYILETIYEEAKKDL
ncbi:dihydroxyacetone kinase subunit L [Clostridium baratii]|uniref:dihydroxyacetone kinase subunit DhaL n=1 Tax=Clostridium baratii TaxID=1561 RepID=UPI0009A45CE3|nr:dihydroxyacetone kinase subunit DhaL [Clostridium baratii]OPF51233.1 dihydroxyacetone kinase [Clostridium baratii]OPF55690.1 dihydroxyacetone kinase subunit L [Clostridium baratii]OPF56930.1 dihydroxyacetone kinase subunit L [Clostridium baratii]OPF59929.1 dihydroxyacetone kinase subunit L [Clostridium baratii]